MIKKKNHFSSVDDLNFFEFNYFFSKIFVEFKFFPKVLHNFNVKAIGR